MPVTEIAHLTLLETSSVSTTLSPIIKRTMLLQDQWYNAHATGNSSTANPSIAAEHRGAAIFQQVEDPRKILITAHWDSVNEHYSWIASAENKEACEYLFPLVDINDIDFFHVRNAALFPSHVLKGSNDAVEVVLTRFRTRETDRQSFEDKMKQSKDTSESLCGWRIENDASDDADVTQYIVVGEQQLSDLNELERLYLSCEVKHYHKICYE